ncbi:MAG: response regulator [Planctomycetota bacterium]
MGHEDSRSLELLIHAPVMAHSIDERGLLLDVSDEWLRVLGYRREEVIGRPSSDFLSPESAAYAREVILPEFFRTGACRQVPYDFVTKSGSYVPVLLSGVALENEQGEFWRSVAVLTDVSEERLRSAQLKLSFDAAGMQVWNWERVEDAWRWTGRSDYAFSGLLPGDPLETYLALVHPEDLEGTRAELSRGLQEVGASFTLTHRLEDERWVQVVAQVAADPSGSQPTHLIGALRDVTESKQAEAEERRFRERVEQSQRLESLGVLAGGIAHDFNNLLVSVLGNADLALKQLGRGHPTARNLEAIGNAAQRASDLCQQLLAYSGKGRFVVEPVNLTEIVRDMADLLEISVSKRGALRLELDPAVPPVEVDVVQIRQVVMNLITNASEAVEPGGLITLRVDSARYDVHYLSTTFTNDQLTPGRYVQLEVTDTGCGMSEQDQARIFDPFFSTKFTGRGLGLSAVQGIVRGHGGAIRVYSELGKGTTFKVILPTCNPPSEQAEARPAGPSRGMRGRILIVDDQEEVVRVAEQMLGALGLEVASALSGEEGVARYREQRAEVVILDMTMPGMDGYETFRALRELDPDVRVVLSSGYTEQDATHRFVGRGLAGFIQKPYRLDTLEKILRRILE